MKSKNHRSYLILLAAGLAWASPVFSKEKEEIPAPPPMAKTGAATVFLDTPAEIPLQIAGRIVDPLDFLIRKEPKHGTICPPVANPQSSRPSLDYQPNRLSRNPR